MEPNDEFIIVLHIAESTNLNFQNDQIMITATLGGKKLETEFVSSSKSAVVDNNLIWETDKNSIKRMKAENLPIKIECFSVQMNQGHELRSLIGYILLPIRGVPVVPVNKALQTKPHWHKLVGLSKDWKNKKPEISLFLTITDKQNLDPETGGFVNAKNPTVENVESILIEPCKTIDMLKPQNGLHIQLLQEEGLLQVGNFDTECDIFIIKLMFKNARNLEHIVNPEDQLNQIFRFHYNLLGTPTHCVLTPKGNGIFPIQEKIAIHFRTTLKSLNEYFNKILYVPIDLYCNDTIIGHARFRFVNLIDKFLTLDEFKRIHETNDNTFEADGTFLIETLFDLPPTALTPFIEYLFSIKYLSTTKISNCEVVHDERQMVEFIDNQAGGDMQAMEIIELPPAEDLLKKDIKPIETNPILPTNNDTYERNNSTQSKIRKYDTIIPKSAEPTNIEALIIERNEAKCFKNIPKTFSFNLILQTIRFSRRPEVGIWQISLHHPKAETPYLANVELSDINSNIIEFKNLELQLFFVSTVDDILNLIESDSCTLNVKGPHGIHATAELDNEIILVGTQEKRSGVILMENQCAEKIAMSHIFVYLDDLGFNFNSQLRKYPNLTSQTRSSVDENLAYKIIEELEDWKLKQQEDFLIELKRKEIKHLANLSNEWQKKKIEQEIKLAQKLEQCTILTSALEEAHQAIKEKGIHQLEKERIVERTKLELEQMYSNKLIDLKEKSRRLEEDMLHKMNLQDLKFQELETSKSIIIKENKNLCDIIKKLENQIADMKTNFLPREQLAGLFQDLRILNERLEEVEKSKIFYKNQWAKIIREVHKLKTENLQQIELKLKENHSSGLKEFITTEHDELLSEREELNYIKNIFESDTDSLMEDASIYD